MIGVTDIIFERNGRSLIININNESKIIYENISLPVDNALVFRYLNSLLAIINSWEKEYINTKIINSDRWKLSLIYLDGSKKEYYGKSSFPINFEAFERLNQKLIDEVQHG